MSIRLDYQKPPYIRCAGRPYRIRGVKYLVLPHVVAEAVIDEGVRGQKWPGAERQSNVFLRAQLQARGNLPCSH
jgi:hypothetical protein